MVLKYRVGIRWGIAVPHGHVGSLALVGDFPRDSVSIKILVVVAPHQYYAQHE